MARDEAPPFERGQTFYNGATIDSGDYGGTQLEGMEWEFEDLDYSANGGVATKRSNERVRCRCVRNVSGGALLPKRLVTFSADEYFGRRVDGYGNSTAEQAYPVDEFLPSAGVPDGDLFWIVVKGPATVLTDLAGGANNVHSIGNPVVSLTAATSGATTAGRVAPIDLTGATVNLGNQVVNWIGRAMSAKTTGNTGADLLINVGKW